MDWQAVLNWVSVALGFALLLGLVTVGGLGLQALAQYLRAKAEIAKHEAWYAYAYSLVQAAEQWLGKEEGAAKFEWVAKWLKEAFPKLTDDQVRWLIEAAVYAVRQATRGYPEPEPPVLRGANR